MGAPESLGKRPSADPCLTWNGLADAENCYLGSCRDKAGGGCRGVVGLIFSLEVHIILGPSILPTERMRARYSMAFGCLWAPSPCCALLDFSQYNKWMVWSSSKTQLLRESHFLRERWWISLTMLTLRRLWDIHVDMTGGLLDRGMELRRCLDGTNRRRHHPWGGDKLKSCPGSNWRLSLWKCFLV